MVYCTYEQYEDLSGTLEEDAFAVWAGRASRVIDRLTLGRAERHAKQLPDELADACARIADLLAGQAQAAASSKGGALASFNNDGYSESYSSAVLSGGSRDAQARALLADSLGEDRYGLLWRGL